MLEIDQGTTGAKRQTWRDANPRDVLRKLVDDHKKATKEELLALFTEEVRENEAHLATIIEYWFANNYRSLVAGRPNPVERIAKRAASKAVAEHIVKQAVEKKAQILLLDLMMPNGKPLRDCTGKDCASLAKKVGPWLAVLGQKVRPGALVGDTLSEAEVRQLYG